MNSLVHTLHPGIWGMVPTEEDPNEHYVDKFNHMLARQLGSSTWHAFEYWLRFCVCVWILNICVISLCHS